VTLKRFPGAAVQAELIRQEQLSSRELIDAYIHQIEAVDSSVNAMVIRAFDRARTEADAADQTVKAGNSIGPLHGVPVAIKDNQITSGIRTTFGSEQYANNIPSEDSGIVGRIRNAGGTQVGMVAPRVAFSVANAAMS